MLKLNKLWVALLAGSLAVAAHAVTLNVNVPSGTRACYVVGDFQGWNAANAVKMIPSGANSFTLSLPEVSATALAAGYKYLCGPDWTYVEKDASGNEIGNRTVAGNPDVVGSWYHVFNPDIESFTLKLNGYNRKVQVALPDGYADSSDAYPVVYLTGVQQRFNNAGDDSDHGNDFFGAQSWNIPTRISKVSNVKPVIFVAVYGYFADTMPFRNPEFEGSGEADNFINDITSVLMPEINKRYRTLPTSESTAIAGADLGGMLALYAAATRPEVFGTCVAMSPLTVLNPDEMATALEGATASQRYILTYGTAEPISISGHVEAMASTLGAHTQNVVVGTFAGATHNDDAWGQAFPSVYKVLTDPTASFAVPALTPKAIAQAPAAGVTYTLHNAIDSQSLKADTSAPFTSVTYHKQSGTAVPAMVSVKTIDKSVKTKYYWNVEKSANGTKAYLMSSNKDVSFSSKKSSDSWHRVIIYEDESTENIAASSTAFRMVTKDATTTMTVASGYIVTAKATFTTSDKSVKIHYGSVNSGSDMGVCSPTVYASANCTEANVTFNFATNEIVIEETATGQTIDNVTVTSMQAIPAVTRAGETATIKIEIAEASSITPSLTFAYNYGTATSLPLTKTGTSSWQATLANLSPGMYTLSLSVTRGGTTKKDVAQTYINVTDGEVTEQKTVVVNAYADVDWDAYKQYKGNFHTHTSQSFDTQFNVTQVVDRYKGANYDILALTDHDANPYPWTLFDVFNSAAQPRDPQALGMLAIPGNELSKDDSNSWSEKTGGEFNHHNDFFTGRRGQEFSSLRESYAYTYKLGGMQIINHPGQYWNLSTSYTGTAKNSPAWHAENFNLYPSLVGLEVYNQGNRRPNDRILWDQILTLTMPERPVWGYSNDDTHTAEQYFRNYQYMLMPALTVDELKIAMAGGHHYFCYEYTGSGQGKTPRISNIAVDDNHNTITVDTDADDVKWISGTDRNGDLSTRKSTVVGIGKTFDFTNFQGSYVRALITNPYGETCTQPFGFAAKSSTQAAPIIEENVGLAVFPSPAVDMVNVVARNCSGIGTLRIFDLSGRCMLTHTTDSQSVKISVGHLPSGIYVVVTDSATAKLIKL